MTTKRERIVVSIYSEEYETVNKKLGIKECIGKTIREALGLKPNAKGTGENTQIRKALKEKLPSMTPEQKKEFLEKLGLVKIVEKTDNGKHK